MKENDVQKVYWAAYEDGEVMESDDGILLISFDKETVEHYPSLPNQVLQVMICRPPTSRPVDAALKSPPEIEPLGYLHEIKEPQGQDFRMYSASKESPWSHWQKQHLSECDYKCTPLYAALPHCPDGEIEIYICEGCGCPTKHQGWTWDKYLNCCPERKPVKHFVRKIATAEGK